MSLIDPETDLDFACALADAARAAALPYFRAGTEAVNKAASGFDPVTAADQAVEAAIRAMIADERPGDGVRGEEAADQASKNGRTWVIDPIDGTRAFLAGLPTWCVLIALSDDDGPVLSVIDQPFTGERYLGLLGARPGAWLDLGGERIAIKSRTGVRLAEAIGTSTDPYLFSGAEARAFDGVRGASRLVRYGLDAYGYAQTALGGVDFVVENGLRPWDVAALVPVVEGAGGVITDWRGRPCHEGGQVAAAGSAALHAELLEILAPAAA